MVDLNNTFFFPSVPVKVIQAVLEIDCCLSLREREVFLDSYHGFTPFFFKQIL